MLVSLSTGRISTVCKSPTDHFALPTFHYSLPTTHCRYSATTTASSPSIR